MAGQLAMALGPDGRLHPWGLDRLQAPRVQPETRLSGSSSSAGGDHSGTHASVDATPHTPYCSGLSTTRTESQEACKLSLPHNVAGQQAAAWDPCQCHWSLHRPQAHLGILDVYGSGCNPVYKLASTTNLELDGYNYMRVMLVQDS